MLLKSRPFSSSYLEFILLLGDAAGAAAGRAFVLLFPELALLLLLHDGRQLVLDPKVFMDHFRVLEKLVIFGYFRESDPVKGIIAFGLVKSTVTSLFGFVTAELFVGFSDRLLFWLLFFDRIVPLEDGFKSYLFMTAFF